MAIIPAQSMPSINGFPIDGDNTTLIFWGPMQAGDEGAPAQVYAYQRFAWHFTGAPEGDVITNPNIPIASDRSITVLGSNDGVCYGPIFPPFVATDPAGMNARIDDPMRVSHDDGAYLFIKPVVGGSVNPAGADCALLLYCAKFFGPRT